MANIILTEKIYASANFKTTVTNFAAYMLHQYIRTNRKELKIQQIGERVYYDDGQVVEKTLSRAITFSIPRENFAFPADRKLMVYEVVDKLPDEKPFFTIQLVGVGASGLFLPIMPSLLANAAKRYGEDLLAGKVKLEEMNEETLRHYLYHPELPDVDLLIRTSGEERISNFLLYELAYAELYFTPTYWPDFGKEELGKALEAYQHRNRRFGRVSA